MSIFVNLVGASGGGGSGIINNFLYLFFNDNKPLFQDINFIGDSSLQSQYSIDFLRCDFTNAENPVYNLDGLYRFTDCKFNTFQFAHTGASYFAGCQIENMIVGYGYAVIESGTVIQEASVDDGYMDIENGAIVNNLTITSTQNLVIYSGATVSIVQAGSDLTNVTIEEGANVTYI